ncbi:MAG TPA: 2OG-Fe dioxygenase family protein [Gemmataceae bacterium]|jgi:hypothetical protein|nr:2OG-Fe dioxygenase family protein [Gemmataceae bacterium]
MQLITIDQHVRRDIAGQGFAWIPRVAWSIGPQLQPHWQRLCEDWDHLEPDRYLERGATFRLRRYGRYSWSPANDALLVLPQEPYFQPDDENPYAGGIARDFAPLQPDTVHNPFLKALVRATFACLPVADNRQGKTWEVRIHQIRIVASPEEPGQPAPEGIHQDGTDFLTLHLVRRHNIVGGESTIYDLDRQPLQRYTMRETLDSLILEDPRIMHAVTTVHSADGRTLGTRDLMGLDFIHCPHLQQPV